ncbi:MAG: sulfur carrier protein ThiS [Desulfovibrionales bacterium]|nr:sulfur carrier protein ThiS [Desulfovibrionales bacterium]
MQLTVNGQMQLCDDDTTLLDYLQGIGVNVEAVVVEWNRVIVKSEDFERTVLNNGDELEILQFVGGG